MASKNIKFSSIIDGIKVRGTYIEQDIRLANNSLPSGARRIMVIGQRTSAGTVAELVAKQAFSGADASGYWGIGSTIALMIDEIIKKNPYVEVWGVALNDAGAGVAASGTITIGGPSTAVGTLRVYVAGQYVDIAIGSADSANTIAAAVNAAINAKTSLPVTSTVASAVVTVTAKNKGLCGNDIGMGYELTGGTGVTCTIVQLTSGATNPTLQSALNVIAGDRYHIIVTPFNNQTDLTTLSTHITNVSGWNNPRACIGVWGYTGVLANYTTLTDQVNMSRQVAPYIRYTTATKRRHPSWIVAAIAAAAEAARKLQDPAMDMDVSGIAVPDVADRFIWTEEQSCLTNGGTPITIGSGETPVIKRMPTTYSTDGNSQPVLLDVHKITAMDYYRDALLAELPVKMPKKIKRTAPKTEDIGTSIVRDVALRCEEAGVLDDVLTYKDLYRCEEDLQNAGQLNFYCPSPVGDGTYVLAVKQVLY